LGSSSMSPTKPGSTSGTSNASAGPSRLTGPQSTPSPLGRRPRPASACATRRQSSWCAPRSACRTYSP
jgi:hypothetical protein